MIKKLCFVPLSFWSTLTSLGLVFFWFILPCSGIFRYHSCSFLFIPVLFCLISVYSNLFRSVLFLGFVTPVKLRVWISKLKVGTLPNWLFELPNWMFELPIKKLNVWIAFLNFDTKNTPYTSMGEILCLKSIDTSLKIHVYKYYMYYSNCSAINFMQ